MITLEDLARLPPEHQLLLLEEEELRRERGRKLYRFFPDEGRFPRAGYLKHLQLFRFGATHRQRAFMAANRVGKSMAGLYEVALHMTGQYPDWWEGKRYRRPVRVWIAGDTAKSVRESLQDKMLGEWGDFGTGMIPRDCLLKWTPKAGVPETVDTFAVKHKSGQISRAEFKSYDQKRISFQATERDIILLDEEPPEDIYVECLTRTMTNNGLILLTFTPLKGVSSVVVRYLTNGVPVEGAINDSRALVSATWDDVPHLTEKDKVEILAEYPAEQRAARSKGVPMLGSGMVFTVPEEDLLCDPFDIPAHWPQGGGLDFGWDHPTGAARLAWDRDNGKDVLYLVATWRARQHTPAMVAPILKPWGDWLPWAWPHDGLQHDKGSGEQLATQYRNAGLNLMAERATFPDGSNGVEAGILEMLDRMKTGRFKVFNTCADFREEYRTYHRKDGIIVKVQDDVISAARYAVMMRRQWRTKPKQTKLRINTDWRRA